jgi:hypothetical protein
VIDSSRPGALVGAGPSHIASSPGFPALGNWYGQRLATTLDDWTVRVWNVESGSEIVVGIHVKEVESVLWSRMGSKR